MKMPDYIVFFDGVCNFCNRYVNFIIKHDKRNRLRFSSIQGFSDGMFDEHYVEQIKANESVVFYKKGRFYIKSRAVLEIALMLGFPFSILYLFRLIPGFIRDAFYDVVAKNRYRWFGKREFCQIPSQADKERFLN